MKHWYQSKTLWINLIAVVAFGMQTFTGKDIITPEMQAMALAVINMVLRAITKHELTK